MRILDLIDLNYGDTLKQGDSTRLRFQLSARDYLLPDNEGKQARIVFHFNNSIVHEEYSTVQRGNVVEFSINEILPPNVYILEIHVDGQIFPSDDYVFKIKLSAAGIDHEITKSYGINNIIERAVDLVSAKFINLTKEKLGLGNVINVKQASEVEISQARGSYPTLAEHLLAIIESIKDVDNEMVDARGMFESLAKRLSSMEGVDDEIKTLISVASNRLDTIIANAGDGTIPTELVDVRVGFDGTQYDTAGEAVRKQIDLTEKSIANIYDYFTNPIGGNVINKDTERVKILPSTNVWEEEMTLYDYTTYQFYVQEDCQVWLDTLPDYYFSIALHEGKTVIKEKFIARYRTPDDNLPTQEDKLLVKKNTLISITVDKEVEDWELSTDYRLIKSELSENIEFGVSQINQIKGLFPYVNKTFNRDTPMFDVRKFTSVSDEITTLYSYTSYLLYIEQDCHVWVDTIPDYYFSIALHEGREVIKEKFIARYRTLDNNLPTSDNKLLIEAGTLMSITVANEATDWSLNTDYELIKSAFSQNVELGRGQINQIKSLFPDAGNASFCNYINGAGDQESTERLEIYLPSGVGYIKYQFVHSVSTAINTDCWHIYKADYVDSNLNHVAELTQSGEWETAIRLDMRDDFSGGYLHGDEKTTSINFFVDGKHINDLSVLSKISFDNLRIVASSELYDPKDHTTLIAENGKEYVFSKGSLTINQRLVWKVDGTLTTSYLAMFPVNKTVTSKIYTDKDFNVRDITYGEIEGVRSAITFNDNFVAKFSIPKYSTKLTKPVYLITDNGGRSYNKQYYIASRQGQTVTVGEVWETETVYELQYSEQV